MTRRRVAWVYQGDHTRHPFIRIACDDLAASGDDVTVVDLAATPGLAGAYIHTPAASRRSSQRAGHGLIARGVRHTNFLVRAIILIAHARPDVLICTMPAALAAGSIVAKVRGSRLVYYTFELFGEQVGRTSATLRLLERFLLKHAVDAVVTQNEERARVYVEERSCRVEPHIVRGWWKDTGRLEDMLAANRLVLDTIVGRVEGELVDSQIDGRIVIEAGARLERSAVRGPAIIGAGAQLTDCYIGPYTAIGERCTIQNAEVEHSILLAGSSVSDLAGRMESSLLGRNVKIGRDQRQPRAYRFMVGDNSEIGIL